LSIQTSDFFFFYWELAILEICSRENCQYEDIYLKGHFWRNWFGHSWHSSLWQSSEKPQWPVFITTGITAKWFNSHRNTVRTYHWHLLRATCI